MAMPMTVLFLYHGVRPRQQCFYFSPLPQGQGSLRPGSSDIRSKEGLCEENERVRDGLGLVAKPYV